METSNLFRWIKLTTLSLVIAGCGYLGNPGSHILESSTSKGGFDELTAKVLAPKCLQCHAGDAAAGGYYSLSSYASTLQRVVPGDPDASVLVQRVRDGSMPPGSGLSPKLISLIEQWVAAGAPENGTDGGSGEAKDPVADAGPDQFVTLPAPSGITLVGGASAPRGIQDVQWVKISGPPVTMTGANTNTLTLTDLNAGVYQFVFRVTDKSGAYHEDVVTLVVNNGEGMASASAGQDKYAILPGNSISFSGTATPADGGTIVSYQWLQKDGPSTATLSGANTANLTASNLVEGIYLFELKVTDSTGATGSATVMGYVTSPTYAWIYNNILYPACVSCHRSGRANGNARYDGYSQTMQTVSANNPNQSKLFTVLANGTMPKGLARAPESYVETVRRWIQNGALNN